MALEEKLYQYLDRLKVRYPLVAFIVDVIEVYLDLPSLPQLCGTGLLPAVECLSHAHHGHFRPGLAALGRQFSHQLPGRPSSLPKSWTCSPIISPMYSPTSPAVFSWPD